jgi:hypothetical protein
MTFLKAGLVTATFLMGWTLFNPIAEAVKPMVPLQMILKLEGTPQVGGEVPVVLRIRSFIEAPSVKIQWTLPSGIEMVSEGSSWEGELKAGLLKEMRVVLKISEPGRHAVMVMATLQYQNGTQMTRGTTLVIDSEADSTLGIQSQQKIKPKKKTPVIRKGEDGQNIGEYPLD